MSLLLYNAFPYIPWPSGWSNLAAYVGKFSQETKVTTIYWTKPLAQMVKLNSDASAFTNPGRIGVGEVIRDHNGDVIYAYAAPLGQGTNNQVEVEAAIWGLSWCLSNGIQQVVMEVNSELLVRWIKKQIPILWHLQPLVESLMKLISQLHLCICRHVYREANFVADVLSKVTHQSDHPQHYFHSYQLPSAPTGYFQLDKLGMPSFKRRKVNKL
ncbi:hypothetical protein P3S68_014690 [Capsicum galapagoense]